MFYSTLLLAATALTGLVSAQNYSTTGPLTIDPNGVDTQTRLAWCVSETTSCPQICGGSTSANTCDSNTLNYTCTCAGGNTPNISDYQQTIPFFVCQQWRINCVAAHPNDLQGQAGCHSVVCGAKNASAANSGSSSSSSGSDSATGSSTQSATGAAGSASATGSAAASSASGGAASATSAAASATSSAASAAMGLAVQYSSGILAAGMLAFFGLAL